MINNTMGGGGKKVFIVKANLPDDDSRILKEADSLKINGYIIKAIGWGNQETDSNNVKSPFQYEKRIYARNRPKSSFSLFSLITAFPLWWWYIFTTLLFEDWDIAHVINLHSILPAIIAGKIKNKPVIYEIEDVHEDGDYFSDFIRKVILKIDKLFMALSSAVILVDENQINEFDGIPNDNIVTIYDSPINYVQQKRIVNKKNKESLLIFNDGMFYKNRDLLLNNLFSAVKNTNGVKLVMSGTGDQVQEIADWCNKYPEKFEFLGYISYDEVIQKSLYSDVLLGIRSSSIIANKYNCGSKLMKSMMCGKPCIVNSGTLGAEIVNREKCGIVVNAEDENELINALIKLKNKPELREFLGNNARKAYDEKYGWPIMEKKLFNLYNVLLK